MTQKRIKLRHRSTAREIVETLNKKGLKTKTGKDYTTWQVYQVARGSYADENIQNLLEELI